MKRITSLLSAAVLVGSGITLSAPVAAEAASTACVTKWEYQHMHRNKTVKQTKALFDINGYQEGYVDHGSYYEGAWIEDGYWVYDGYFIDDVYYDTSYWEDTSYYDESGGAYVLWADQWRSYKKCKSFDKGRGRVGVNFDTYSSPYNTFSGFRSYSKVRNFREYLNGRTAGKSVPDVTHTKPPKPAVTPGPKDPAKVAQAKAEAATK